MSWCRIFDCSRTPICCSNTPGWRQVSGSRGSTISSASAVFCKRCAGGIYAWGDFGSGKFDAVQVTALDDLDPDELAAAPLKYEDGLHDRWDRVPEDLRLL